MLQPVAMHGEALPALAVLLGWRKPESPGRAGSGLKTCSPAPELAQPEAELTPAAGPSWGSPKCPLMNAFPFPARGPPMPLSITRHLDDYGFISMRDALFYAGLALL